MALRCSLEGPLKGSVCLWAIVLACGSAAGCSTGPERRERGNNNTVVDDPELGGGEDGGVVDVGGEVLVPQCNPCENFPAAPLFDEGVATDAADLFQGAPSGSGPCLLEPPDGALFPANWAEPRVHFTSPGTVFQITFSTERETNDLVAYTESDAWIMPRDIWKGIAASVFEEDITVTVRASTGSGSFSESTAKFRIAPVEVGGSMVFWASTTDEPGLDTTSLLGFSVGDQGVISALTPGQVEGVILDDSPVPKREQFGAPKGQVRCVGCHTSTPDGASVAITDHWPWNVKVAGIEEGSVGEVPDFVSPVGSYLLQMPWMGVTTFSLSDWNAGNRTLVTSMAPNKAMDSGFKPDMYNAQGDIYGGNNKSGKDNLVWLDLEASGDADDDLEGQDAAAVMAKAKGDGWNVIERDGDSNGAVTPDWSHDGKTIAYTHTNSTSDGRVGDSPTVVDIYTVPYGGGKGGDAQPVSGADSTSDAEYYPDFSPDDRYLAFTHVANASGEIYYRPEAEIFVVPSAGGDAVRLAANDPPACSAETSPGVLNSWPKWAPLKQTVDGKTYYFLIFSSARQSPFDLQITGNRDKRASQLYMTTIVEDEDGQLVTYPAVYLWNQQTLVDGDAFETIQTSNLTPAWDAFQIPEVPVIIR